MRTEITKKVSQPQLKKIHVLLSHRRLMDEKKSIIYNLTAGRTTSSKDLTFDEAQQLISFLALDDREKEERRKSTYRMIWYVACKIEFIYGDTSEDYEINKAKLDLFCRTRGSAKKNLSEMNYTELRKTLTQFKSMEKTYLERKKQGILPYKKVANV